MFGSHAAAGCQVADADAAAVNIIEDLVEEADGMGGVEVHPGHRCLTQILTSLPSAATAAETGSMMCCCLAVANAAPSWFGMGG
jgi:hypothetical protein